MALRKPTFEGQDNGAVEGEVVAKTVETVAETAAPVTEAQGTVAPTNVPPAEAPTQAEAPAQTTAVAAAPQKTAMAVGGAKYQPALQEYKDQIDPSTLDFDTFPRVTVGLDGFSDDKDTDLGKKIKVKLMSWNERFIVTPGVDNEEANKLVAYSLDGKTIDQTGQSTADYLKYLVDTEGYKEAAIKKYYAIYGFMVFANDKDIPPEDQSIVSVQVPPRSVSRFTRFQIENGVKVAQGIVQPSDLLVLSQEVEKGKSRKYASINFSAK